MTITIQDLHFIKMNKSIKLYTVDMEKLVLNFQLTASFGNEYNNNNTYVNWIVENSIVNQITRLERDIYEHMVETYDIDESWSWKTSLRKNKRWKTLLRTKNVSENDYEQDGYYDVDVTIDGIWLHKNTKTFGLLLLV